MEQYYGMTAELYRAVTALVDDRMKEIRVVRQDFDRLVRAQVRTERRLEELAAAQARTEARVEELAAAQARTEARVEELAAAQARTEERLTRLEATVERLAEAQARTEERLTRLEATVERLAEAQARTEERLTRLEATVERLAEAQARTEERLTRLEATVERLAEAQARTEERLTRLEATVERLAEAQARTEERLTRLEATVEKLAEAQARTEERLQNLITVVGGMQNTLAAVKGRQLELTYREKAGAYFGPLLRRLRVLSPVEIEEDLETLLSPEEFRDLLAVDLLVSGQPRYRAEAPQVWLAVEVSATVDRRDVERALKRAALLQRAGLRAIPTVAGEEATLGAKEEAEAYKVLMLQDGRTFFWEEALAKVLD